MTSYTFEIYKEDRRRKSGWRLDDTKELSFKARIEADDIADWMESKIPNSMVKVHQTWVEVRSIMNGAIVREHYTTPFHCSVASETYWSS